MSAGPLSYTHNNNEGLRPKLFVSKLVNYLIIQLSHREIAPYLI